jgi:hypothetical protein
MPDETPTPAPAAPAPAAAKKEKPPAKEDKPFREFVTQDLIPGIQTSLEKGGITDLKLSFEEQPLPVTGDRCWQIRGIWAGGQRRFLIGFSQENLTAPKVFALAEGGVEPSLLEAFLIDEKKITLDLITFWVSRRLNGQKWLGLN